MPFANLTTPSIALTQLRSVTRARFGNRVAIDIIYLTHDFGQFLGVDPYNYVSNSMEALYAGLGDWFFRAAAFPELPDNTDAYLRRFFQQKTASAEQVKQMIARKRPKLDAYMDTLIARYALDKADVVGFTSMFMQNAASFAMARKLKRKNPHLVTVLGGANCELPMGHVIARRVPEIDFVFTGPALKTFPDFVQRCLDGDVARRSSPGVLAKDVDEAAGGATLGEELSIDAPIPLDYDEFMRRFEAYFSNAHFKPVAPIETSRGCWWGQRAHCTFCGLNGATMAYKAMTPALAIEQFKSLFRYRRKVRVIEAVDNILPKEYIDEVLPFLDTPDDMEVFYEVKADLSKRDMAALARANVRLIQPGIEALATSTLKLMKKGTTAFQNITFLKNCGTFGIKPFWNLLVGFPGETADVYRRYADMIPLLTHLPPPTGVYPVRFDRFSPYHKNAASYGLDLRPMDFYTSVYPFEPDDLKNFAYYFADHNYTAEYVQAVAEWLTKLRALVAEWHAKWSSQSAASRPALYFKDDSDLLIDSRSGTAIERRIGAVGRRLVIEASRPVRVDDLVKRLPYLPAADVVGHSVALEDAGILLREGDRVLSLVVGADRDDEMEAGEARRHTSFDSHQPSGSSEHFKLLPVIAG
jgi:ribosomal peptide maturation radical SAM protein 1